MTTRRIEQLLWIVSVVVALTGTASAIVMQRPPRSTEPAMPLGREPSNQTAAAKAADDQLRAILAGDVFRRERAAPDSTIQTATQATPRPPTPPKPRLMLRGLVGGPPWNAIIEGIPGHDGSYVVRAGDSVSGLRIRSVNRDGTTIRGMDTTWTLKLGRAP